MCVGVFVSAGVCVCVCDRERERERERERSVQILSFPQRGALMQLSGARLSQQQDPVVVSRAGVFRSSSILLFFRSCKATLV